MNKHCNIEDQIMFLEQKGVLINNKAEIENFLSEIPFQRSFNQLKYYYADTKEEYENTRCFEGMESQELQSKYLEILKDSHDLLNEILKFENKVKNALFFDMLEVYNSNEALYIEIVNETISKTKKASQFAFPNSTQIEKENIEKLYKEKIYKVINASSLKELRDIVNILFGHNVSLNNLYTTVENSIETTEKMKDEAKKQYFVKLLTENEVESIKVQLHSIIESDFKNIFAKSFITNEFPLKIIKESENNILKYIGSSKLNKFFKDNQAELNVFKTQIDSTKVKSKIKKDIENSDQFKKLIKIFIDANDDCIYIRMLRELSKASSETKCDVTSYRNRLNCDFEIDYMVLIKKFAIISSFRNTISHGNTLIITLKPQKEKIYIEAILKSLLNTENRDDYIELLYKDI